jgi:uncharacterized membrane protein YphA (DoxX/SURF4 family)
MKGKAIGYWVCTVLLASSMLMGGMFGALRVPQAVAGQEALGFPGYFVVFLGVWKILGAIAIVAPGFPRLKEWAYAGIFFDLSGAVVATWATGGFGWHVVAPAFVGVLLVGSWWLRPDSRRLAGPSV